MAVHISFDESVVKPIALERFEFHCSEIMPEMSLSRSQMEFYQRLDHRMLGIVIGMRAWFLNGHKQDVRKDHGQISFPASPWEFWKQRYAPKWFLRRWPVKLQSHEVVVAVHNHYVCPHVHVPEERTHYGWMGEMSGQIPRREDGR